MVLLLFVLLLFATGWWYTWLERMCCRMFDFPKPKRETLAFSDIDLEKPTLKRLRFLRKGNLYGDSRDDLCVHGLAEEIKANHAPGGKPAPTGKIKITDRGKAYLRYRNKDLLRTWLPITISILSLLVSIAAYLRSS